MLYGNFKKDCLNKKCNRNTFISKKCEKEYKIKNCYQKFLLKVEKDKIKKENQIIKQQLKQQEEHQRIIKEFEEKKELYLKGELQDLYGFQDQVDEELLKVYSKVDKRDNFQCVVWNHILTLKEKKYVLENFYNEFKFHGKILEHAHIEAISNQPSEKYNVNNIVLMSQFFHTRFDNYKNILNGEDCDKNYRKNIQEILKEYIRSIK